jgi:organic radical activating enzyme
MGMRFITGDSDVKSLLSDREVVIYGAGHFGRIFHGKCKRGKINVTAFIDNNKTGTYDGINISKPHETFARKPSALYVTAINGGYQALYNDCVSNGIPQENIFVFLLKSAEPLPLIHCSLSLVRHCNLNCRGCDHFSPIADKWYANVELYRNDIRRMSDVFGGIASNISLLGGEPLLHPQLIAFMETTREYFNEAIISIITNGLLLSETGRDFWDACKSLGIDIKVTKYPVSLNCDVVMEKAAACGVAVKYFNNANTVKTMSKFTIDTTGGNNPETNFNKCRFANNCVTLSEGGNLHTCQFSANIDIFNKYFNQHIKTSPLNSINIYEESDAEKILSFLSKPIPMCGYCDISNYKYGLEWAVSKGDISEWI